MSEITLQQQIEFLEAHIPTWRNDGGTTNNDEAILDSLKRLQKIETQQTAALRPLKSEARKLVETILKIAEKHTGNIAWEIGIRAANALVELDKEAEVYAAPIPQTQETLDKPARVRGVVFNPGVKVMTVIQAAQRCFEEYVPEDAPGIKQEILRGLANSSQLSGEQAMIKLSNDQIDILGRPNFACAKIAKYLIAAGVYEDKAKKAEYEQAVFIHWAMALFDEHGEKWREVGEKFLSECDEKIKNKAVGNEQSV